MADINKLQTLIQLRRGYQAQWDAVANTYIPKAGEPCVTLDGNNKGQIKIGDGTSTWGELKYVGVSEGAMSFAGTVATKADLPDNAKTGDIYQVTEDNKLYIWDGDSWEIFQAVDMSNYYTKEETADLVNVEINKVKADLEVIKIYGDSVVDTSVEVDGQKYDTASEAIAAVNEGGTVKLSGGLGAGEVINADKKFTLDMNNVAIVDNEKTPVNVSINGALTLTGNGSVECNKNGKATVDNNGSLTVENGSYARAIDEKGNGYYTCVNHGKMVINDGIFSAPRGLSSLIENGYYSYTDTNPAKGYVEGTNQSSPELTINGGTYITKFWAVKNDDNAKLIINDGSFYGSILNSGLEMTINGGNFSVDEDKNLIAIIAYNTQYNPAKTLITGGTFNGYIANQGLENTVIEIKGGKFSIKLDEKFIAEGYEQKFVDGYYVVSAKA